MGSLFASSTRAASNRMGSEDRAEVFEHEDTLIILVADGAGGVTGGAVASDTVIDAVRARVAERPFDPYNIRAWSDVLSRIDVDLARSSTGGETTAIIVVVGPHGVVGVSAGDSEAWVVGPRADRLTAQQDRARVGTGRCRPKAFHRPQLGGVLVVATDGLFKYARSDAILAACAAADVSTLAERLVGLPKLRSGAYPDDLAVVVVIPRSTPP